MDNNGYVKLLGFAKDPFLSTNADKEDLLSKYFIAPDYYDEIWGDPINPSPTIIYGPRGSGKTAQKNMIEFRNSSYKNILTINYTEHDLADVGSIDNITLDYHLEYLNRLLLVSVFANINNIDSFTLANLFTFDKRQYLYKLAKRYLSKTPFSFHQNAIRSLKTIEDLGIDIWDSLSRPISTLINSIGKKETGLDIDLSGISSKKERNIKNKENFTVILSYLKVLGYDSIYILIDKVDENELTGGNNPEDSFKFIAPLIKNLEILETGGVAFKFFLWDELKQYVAKYGRPDRIFSYYLEWSNEQLIEMLNNRVKTYSEGKIIAFTNLLEDVTDLNKIILFSQGSPRDCIRICKRIISEQERINNMICKIGTEAVERGIKIFTKEICQSIITEPKSLSILGKYSMTTVDLIKLVERRLAYSETLARELLNEWRNYGILEKIGNFQITSTGNENKSYIQYVLNDMRIAKYACPNLTIANFIKKKVKSCSYCGRIYTRDFDQKEWLCPRCSNKN